MTKSKSKRETPSATDGAKQGQLRPGPAGNDVGSRKQAVTIDLHATRGRKGMRPAARLLGTTAFAVAASVVMAVSGSAARAEGEAGADPSLPQASWVRQVELAVDSLTKDDGGRGRSRRETAALESLDAESTWLVFAPSVSFVARDWGKSRRLIGAPLVVTDAVRTTRSSRLAISRVRLGRGRVVPYGQLGLGQWRIDTDLLPYLPRDTEVAVEAAAGLELHLVRGWDVAFEIGETSLYRDAHEPQQVTPPWIWGAQVASSVSF